MEQLSAAVTSHCTSKGRGSVIIPMPARPTVAMFGPDLDVRIRGLHIKLDLVSHRVIVGSRVITYSWSVIVLVLLPVVQAMPHMTDWQWNDLFCQMYLLIRHVS